MSKYIALESPIAEALRNQKLTLVSAAIPETTSYAYSSESGSGSNLLLYGGIAVLLALAAAGGGYYWFFWRPSH